MGRIQAMAVGPGSARVKTQTSRVGADTTEKITRADGILSELREPHFASLMRFPYSKKVVSRLAPVVGFNLAGRYDPVSRTTAARGFANIPTIGSALVTTRYAIRGVIE